MRIFLIGFMGSGKSYWGKRWAEKFSMDFIDLDEEIERREQRSITEIFDKSGEDIFRLIETKTLRDTARSEHCIISCGGGTACFHDNIQWMNEKGATIYLSASPAFLYENIMKEKDARPLVKTVNQAELLFFTEQKLKQRLPFYEKASFHLEAEELNDGQFQKILNDLSQNYA